MAGDTRIVRYIITGDSAGAVKAMKETEVAASKVGSKLEETGGKMKSLGSGMTGFGRKLSALSLPLLAVGGYSIKMGMDFQTATTQLQTQAGASAKELSYLRTAILNLGHTGFDGTELAAALYPIRSDGFKGAEALKVLKAAAAGAQVSGASLTLTANALGGTLRTRLKDVQNAAGAMQILNSTVGLGKFKLEELDEALTTGFLTAAKRAGIGLAETGDALDALARKSVPPQIEATRLQKTLIQFGTVTGIAKKSLRDIGIGQYQLAKDMEKGGLITALQDLQKHLNGISKPEQNYILGEAFGRSKGSANVGALLEALPEMEKIQKQREKYGSIFHALGIKETTATFKMAEAVANLKNALISLGTTLIPVVIPALVKFSKLIIGGIEWLKKMPKPVKDVVVDFAILIAVGGPLLIFFGTLISAVGDVLTGVGKLITLLGKLGPAVATAEGEMGTGLSGLLLDLAPLLAAVAALVAGYEAIKHIKEYFSSSNGAAHSRSAKALKKLRQPSEFQSAIGGAKAMLGGHINRAALAGVAPGSYGEAQYLKELAAGPGSTELRGRGKVNPAVSLAVEKRIRERNERMEHEAGVHGGVIIHNHLYIDGKEVGVATAPHVAQQVRNHAAVARPMAEGITKYAQNRAARE